MGQQTWLPTALLAASGQQLAVIVEKGLISQVSAILHAISSPTRGTSLSLSLSYSYVSGYNKSCRENKAK